MSLPLMRRPRSSRLHPSTCLLLGSGSLMLSSMLPALADTEDRAFDASFMHQAPGQSSDAGALALQSLAATPPWHPDATGWKSG